MNHPHSLPFKILILCTGNSARSILGEYLIRDRGCGRFEVYSAGSKPTGRVHPLALRVLRETYGFDASQGRSKSWDEFRGINFDCVITVCGNAKEACPAWLHTRLAAHWGSLDPAAVEGTEEQRHGAFIEVAAQIARRAELLGALSAEKLVDAASIRAIGELACVAPIASLARPSSPSTPAT